LSKRSRQAKRQNPPEKQAAAGQPDAPLDPLRALWALTALALAIILAYSHAFPQGAYPLHAIVPALGLIILSAATVLIALRSPWIAAPQAAPILFPCIFFLWALWRTERALVPSEGTALLGTLLEGCVVFALGLVLALVGRDWKKLDLAAGNERKSNRPAGRMREGQETDSGPRIVLDGLLLFFLLLAAAMALWAVYEFWIRYDQQLLEFYRGIEARGRTLADLSPKEWALLEALRSKRVGSRFGNPNVLAGFLAMIAPLALASATIWKEKSSKTVALAVLGLIWYVVFLTGSRGGLLTLFFATATGFGALGREFLQKRARIAAVAGAVCIAGALLAAASAAKPPSARFREKIAPSERFEPPRYGLLERIFGAPTVSQRIYYLKSGWEMIRQAPLAGQGLGSYAVLYPRHKQPLAREARYPHNIICHFWVELGLVGLLLFGAWVGLVFVGAGRCLRLKSDDPLGIGAKMLLVAAMVFLFNNLFEMTWTFRETYLDWCLVMGALWGFCAKTRPGAKQKVIENEIRPRRLPASPAVAIIALPGLIGAILAAPLLVKPMLAESYRIAATDLLAYAGGKRTEAEILQLAQKAIRLQPKNPWSHHWLACYYRDTGRLKEARKEFEKALALDPYSAAIRADFAALELREGDFDRARQLLAEAVKLYPLNSRYHFLLADLERRAGDLEAARRHIDDALERVLDARLRERYEQFRKDLEKTSPTATLKRPRSR